MMDDIQEQNELAEEIQTITSRPIGFADEFDDVSPLLHVYLAWGVVGYTQHSRVDKQIG